MALIQKHVNGRTDLIDGSGHCVGAVYYGNPDFNLVFNRVSYNFDSLDKALNCAELLSGLCFALQSYTGGSNRNLVVFRNEDKRAAFIAKSGDILTGDYRTVCSHDDARQHFKIFSDDEYLALIESLSYYQK